MLDVKGSFFVARCFGILRGAPLLKSCILASFFFCSAFSFANQKSEIKERLNQIFYWQIAVELNLAPKVEKDLVAIIEDIQSRREKALQERQASLDALKAQEKNLTAKMVEPVLKSYQQALADLAKLDSEEHERLKVLLGSESLAKFYLVRESVAVKIREALKKPELAPKAPQK